MGGSSPVVLVLIACIVAIYFLPVSSLSQNAFWISVRIAEPNTTLMIPLGGPSAPSTVRLAVDWGDSVSLTYSPVNVSLDQPTGTWVINHTYTAPGDYIVGLDRTASAPLNLPAITQFGWYPSSSLLGWSSMPNVTFLGIRTFGAIGLTSLLGLGFRTSYNFSVPDNIPSSITDLSFTFAYAPAFNQANVSAWNVSQVTSIQGMFSNAAAFNQPLNGWDTRSFTTTNAAFVSATAFDQPLSNWDVSKVIDMNNMFSGGIFNQPIGNWDVSKVRYFSNMFYANGAFNQPLNSWNTSSAQEMRNMFLSTNFNFPLDNWDVSSVTDMSSMFWGNTQFNQPLATWQVGKVQNLGSMFTNCLAFNQPLNTWNVSSSVNMDNMFWGATAFNQTLESWCVRNIPTTPSYFAVGTQLLTSQLPIWGTCPTPATVPVSVATVPVASAPASGCVGQAPLASALCIEGRWYIYANASYLESANDSSVTIQPGTTVQIGDAVVARNVTIIVPVGGLITAAGQIHVTNCLSLDVASRARIQLLSANATAAIKDGDKILLISSTRPDCFNASLTASVEMATNQPDCGPTVGASVATQLTAPGSTGLYILFSVTNGANMDRSACSGGATNTGAQLPVVLIAGVVAGAVALVILVTILGVCIRNRRHQREAVRLKHRVETANRSL